MNLRNGIDFVGGKMSGNRTRLGVKFDLSLHHSQLSDVRESESQEIRESESQRVREPESQRVRETRESEKNGIIRTPEFETY